MLGKRIALLRSKLGLTQYELAEKLGFSRGKLSNYEQGSRQPDYETLEIIADFFNVSTDYLLGRTDKKDNTLPKLTEKDERDIAKDLQRMIENINTQGYAHFDGKAIDELDIEDKELLLASLENSMKLAKRLAKQKFTPKKYKNERRE